MEKPEYVCVKSSQWKHHWNAPFSTKVTSDEQTLLTGDPMQGSDFLYSQGCLKQKQNTQNYTISKTSVVLVVSKVPTT